MFFNEPNSVKLQRIARAWQRELAYYCQYLSSYYEITQQEALSARKSEGNSNNWMNSHSWLQSREQFHWWPSFITRYATGCRDSEEARELRDYYLAVYEKVNSIVSELDKDTPT